MSLPLGLAAEIAAVHRDISDADLISEIKEKFPRRDSLSRYLRDTDFYADFIHAFLPVKTGIRVLDVGCGGGLTSSYLAGLGYSVVAIDPVPSNVQYAKLLARRMDANIEVVQTTAEALGSHYAFIGELFDIVLFHSALHHCDDPVAALRNASDLLKEGGSVYLVCEPCLPFIRSKAWFKRMLTENPALIGHYGGNEHIYRMVEYVWMLREAGFTDITASLGPSIYRGVNNNGQSLPLRLLQHGFVGMIQMMETFGIEWIAKPILDRLSLGTRIFSGKKKAA